MDRRYRRRGLLGARLTGRLSERALLRAVTVVLVVSGLGITIAAVLE